MDFAEGIILTVHIITLTWNAKKSQQFVPLIQFSYNVCAVVEYGICINSRFVLTDFIKQFGNTKLVRKDYKTEDTTRKFRLIS